jgi:hypothetical protein
MQAREGSVIRRGNLMAVLAEYTQSDSGSLWRYVIKREDTGEELVDGWAGDPEEAEESAERHLGYLAA